MLTVGWDVTLGTKSDPASIQTLSQGPQAAPWAQAGPGEDKGLGGCGGSSPTLPVNLHCPKRREGEAGMRM